jgi:hypothetical protein
MTVSVVGSGAGKLIGRFLMQRMATYLVVAWVLCACIAPPTLEGEGNSRVDFSGHWELDYQLSEDLREKIRLLHLMARSEAEKRASGPMMGQNNWPGPVVRGGTRPVTTTAGIVGLGQLAEMISRTTQLDIEQSESRIEVNRKDDFSLTCGFYGGPARPNEDVLGSELCGWESHQMVFIIDLPNGLLVKHRLTLSPDRLRLNIATTVRSDGISNPFTLNRVYKRFQPVPEEYECEFTLQNGKVCRRADTPQGSEIR